MSSETKLQITVVNGASEPRQVAIEPWGDVRDVPAGGSCVIEWSGVEPRNVNLSLNGSGIAIWGEPSSVLEWSDEPTQ